MLDRNQRIIVEAIRKSTKIKIVIEGDGLSSEVSLSPSKILSHDIALAVQSHYSRLNK